MPRASHPLARDRAGFTLFETLIALSIMAMAFASLFGTFSTGLGAVRTTRDYVRALSLARALLAERTSGRQYKLGRERGALGGLSWSVEVGRADTLLTIETADDPTWTLYRVRVRVALSRHRDIRLETVRLGKPRDGSSNGGP